MSEKKKTISQEDVDSFEERETEDVHFSHDDWLEGEDELAIPESVRQRFEDKGYYLRWVRFSVNGRADSKNITKRHRQGWTFVRIDEVKELQSLAEKRELGRYGELVTIGDLALAKGEIERIDQVKNSVAAKTYRQLNATDQRIKAHSDIRHEGTESRSSTGRRPTMAD